MTRYYFYSATNTPNWYTFTTDILRENIAKSQDELGKWKTSFPIMFVFTGKCTDAKNKEEAEGNFRNKVNLVDCKEPACMLISRREFFDQFFMVM